MRRYAIVSIRMALVTLLFLGVAYPLLFTGAAQVLLPDAANGSLVRKDGQVIGSRLIGQRFTSPGYFHGRPSAAGSDGYDPAASGASNLAPSSRSLFERVSTAVGSVVAENPSLAGGRVPVDMVTASGSGLDPDITIANALAQLPRVAKARGIPESDLRRLVGEQVTARQFGILGEARLNVLALNLALDERAGGGPTP